MKHTVIYIDGMTCINCQSRIWNVLKLRPEITGITVSYEYSRAEFDYDPKKIRMKEIVKMIEDLGYQVIPAEQFRRKQLRQAAAEIFAIALLFVILQRFGILNHLAPDSLAETGMGYGMLFVIGLITSVHCIAMCGGINLSQTLQKQEANAEEISRSMFRNTFSYNMGRVVSYTVIGCSLYTNSLCCTTRRSEISFGAITKKTLSMPENPLPETSTAKVSRFHFVCTAAPSAANTAPHEMSRQTAMKSAVIFFILSPPC